MESSAGDEGHGEIERRREVERRRKKCGAVCPG